MNVHVDSSESSNPHPELKSIPLIDLDPNQVFLASSSIQRRRIRATTRFALAMAEQHGARVSSTGLFVRVYTLPTNEELASTKYVLSVGHYPGSHDTSTNGLVRDTGIQRD